VIGVSLIVYLLRSVYDVDEQGEDHLVKCADVLNVTEAECKEVLDKVKFDRLIPDLILAFVIIGCIVIVFRIML